jgi:ribose 5-phosphate isomerase B
MNIAVAFDHRGAGLRPAVIVELMSYGHAVLEVGNSSASSTDYVATAHDVAAAILAGEAERGVVVAGSGVGASFVANKIDGIRAAAPTDAYGASHAVADGMNVLCLGARTLDADAAAELLAAFVADSPSATAARYRPAQAPPAHAVEKPRVGSDQRV